jgi:hypothetical protein
VEPRPSKNRKRPGKGHERMCEGWKSLGLLSLLLVNLLFFPDIYFSKKEIIPHTDKNENKIFLIYKEIQIGSGANYEEGLPLIYEEICKFF